ncbi:MAG: hypothetical protein JXQ68_02975 [Campylobacterales bacterium]|nr:hypothetical protein [Campylobacterales bacterium]
MSQITIDVQDDFVYKFLNLLDMLPKDKISIKEDFFSNELKERIQSIKSGSFVTHEEVWGKIEKKLGA